MYEFEYVRPASLNDALAALKADGATAVAGGQTLLPTLKQRLASPSALVDIRQLDELRGIHIGGGSLTIGAAQQPMTK